MKKHQSRFVVETMKKHQKYKLHNWIFFRNRIDIFSKNYTRVGVDCSMMTTDTIVCEQYVAQWYSTI